MHNQASWLSSLNSVKVLPSGGVLLVEIVFQIVQFYGTIHAIQPFSIARFAVHILRTYSAFVPSILVLIPIGQ